MNSVKFSSMFLFSLALVSISHSDVILSDLPPNTVISGENFPDDILTIRDSPGVVVEYGQYRGLVIQRCEGAIVRRNKIFQVRNQDGSSGPEGIMIWGSDYAFVEGNDVRGRYGRWVGTNDGIQVMPDPMNGRNGGNLGSDRWWENRWPIPVPDFTYFYGSKKDGTQVHYGAPVHRFIRGVVLRNNQIHGSGRAGMFFFNVQELLASNNYITNTFDAAISIEHSHNSVLSGNRGAFTATSDPGGLDGGIAALYLCNGLMVVRNDFPGQDYRWYSNNHPNLDNVLRSNKGRYFVSKPRLGDPWIVNLQMLGNVFERLILQEGAFFIDIR